MGNTEVLAFIIKPVVVTGLGWLLGLAGPPLHPVTTVTYRDRPKRAPRKKRKQPAAGPIR